MMNTTQILDIYFGILAKGTAKSNINGGLYKDIRPSTVNEDIVINALPVSNESIQECSVNINIHVPDINVNFEGKPVSVPNHKKLSDLAGKVITDIEQKHSSSYYIYVEFQSLIREPETKSHYVNVRTKFITHKI